MFLRSFSVPEVSCDLLFFLQDRDQLRKVIWKLPAHRRQPVSVQSFYSLSVLIADSLTRTMIQSHCLPLSQKGQTRGICLQITLVKCLSNVLQTCLSTNGWTNWGLRECVH